MASDKSGVYESLTFQERVVLAIWYNNKIQRKRIPQRILKRVVEIKHRYQLTDQELEEVARREYEDFSRF